MKPDSAPGFLGTGWAFPPSFGLGGGQVATVSGAEDISQALLILLTTRLGERPMLEAFGCGIDDLIFEEINQSLINRLTSTIHDAVLYFETRIKLNAVNVKTDPAQNGVLNIQLDYTVLESNSRYNLVFPFSVQEAQVLGA